MKNPAQRYFIDVSAYYNSFEQQYDRVKTFGHFSDEGYSYSITAHDTPRQWLNYDIKPVYQTDKDHVNGYAMTVLVNDDTAYQCPFVQRKGASMAWNNGMVKVTLQKGVNVIRLIPFVQENKDLYANNYMDVDYLEVSGLSGVLPQAISLVSSQAPYVTNWTDVYTDKIGKVANRDSGLTVDNLSKSNLDKASYFAYTIDVPEDGYYDITLPIEVYANNNKTLDNYIGVMVDGAVTAHRFYDGSSIGTDYCRANVSVALTKGIHSILFTSQLPKTGGSIGNTYYGSVTFYGGIQASEQMTTVTGEKIVRAEAEVFGQTSTYTTHEKRQRFSGGYALGGGTYGDYGGHRTEAEMRAGNYSKKLPNVLFSTTVATAGKYSFRLGYVFEGVNGSAMSGSDVEYAYVYVKNANGLSVYTARSGEWVEADFAAGENAVTVVTTLSQEKYQSYAAAAAAAGKVGGYWFNLDYVDFSEGVTVSPLRTGRRLEAETYADSLRYADVESSTRYSGGLAVAGGRYGYASAYTENEMKAGNYVDQPHVIYTVEAPAAGTYGISPGYFFGTAGKYPQDTYVYAFVLHQDGTATSYRVEETGRWIDVQLTEGKNEIAIGVFSKEILAQTGSDGKTNSWINMDYLDVDTALTGVKPQSAQTASGEYTRLEAESDAFYNFYQYSFRNALLSTFTSRRNMNNLLTQTAADLKANGLKEEKMPFVEYIFDVPEEGSYPIRVGFASQTDGDDLPSGNKASIGLFVNGEFKQIDFNVVNDRLNVSTYTDTVKLKAGRNRVIVTAATADSISANKLSSVLVYQDYLDVGATVTDVVPQNVAEAENARLRGYTAVAGSYYSGGFTVGKQNFGVTMKAGITLEKLNADPESSISYLCYVEYKIKADEAGTYPVILIGASGKSGDPGTDDAFITVSLNNGTYKRVDYRIPGAHTSLSRIIWLTLSEGENTLRVTGTLKDVLASGSDIFYFDQDCLIFPQGVNAILNLGAPIGAGDEEMNISDSLYNVDKSKIKPPTVYYVDEKGNVVSEENGKNPATGERVRLLFPVVLSLTAIGSLVLTARKLRKGAARKR